MTSAKGSSASSARRSTVFRTLIVDHIKLARVELAADLKSYGQSVAVLAVAGGVLAIGYVFAWIAAGFGLARLWGAPLAFAAVAALHLLFGAIAIAWAMAKMRRTQLMHDTVVEAKSSASALTRPMQGRALEGRTTDRPAAAGGRIGPDVDRRRDALAQAESDVERARERVESSLLALRDEVVRRTDWRRVVRRQPAAFLGGAIALGILAGVPA